MASRLNANGGSVSLTRHTTVRAIRRMHARHGKDAAGVVSAFNSGSQAVRQAMMNSTGPIAAASDMWRSSFDRHLPKMQRCNHAGEPIETWHAPAAQDLRVLENDAAEFAGGTIVCIRFVVERDANAVLGIIRAKRSGSRDRRRRFVGFRHARPGYGAFPGPLLIRLPEGDAISILDARIFKWRNARVRRKLGAIDDACDLVPGADVLTAIGYAPGDTGDGRKYGNLLL